MHNPEDYRRRKEEVIEHFSNTEITIGSISQYCTLVGIPLTVVYTFIAEENESLREFCALHIGRLKEFYGE